MADEYYGFIYLWENKHPEAIKYKKYIGQHIGSIEDGYIGSGTIFLRKFYSKKYRGYWKRIILKKCNNINDLNNAEIEWITYFNATVNREFCNIRDGGKNGKLHPDTIRKISIKLKGKVPHNKGVKGLVEHSIITKQKIQQSRNIFYRTIFDEDKKKIIEYLSTNKWFKAVDIPHILNRNVSASVNRSRIKMLIKSNSIKHVWFGINDRRYVSLNFSFQNDFTNYLQDNPSINIKQLIEYFTEQYNITETMVRTIVKKLQKSGIIKQHRGYRANYYNV
jgi:DNA-binding Lrp family transcriptional regulator